MAHFVFKMIICNDRWGKRLGLSPSPRHITIIHNHCIEPQARSLKQCTTVGIGVRPQFPGGPIRPEAVTHCIAREVGPWAYESATEPGLVRERGGQCMALGHMAPHVTKYRGMHLEEGASAQYYTKWVFF
jgi:hypothetical protein